MASIFDRFFKKRTSVLVNGELTVTFKSGDTVIFHNATKDMYDWVSNKELTDDDIISYYYEILEKQKAEAAIAREKNASKKTIHEVIQVKEAEKVVREEKKEETRKEVALVEELKSNFPALTTTGDFVEHAGAVYMVADGKEIPLSIPNSLLKKFVDLAKQIEANNDALDEYMALKNFWMWLSLNPRAVNREKLYDFITRNGLKINKHGLFFAYRMILHTNKGKSTMDKALVTAISDAYMKIKKAKKGPKNFAIYQNADGSYSYAKHDEYADGYIGAVGELYANLEDAQEQMFTDDYSQTFDIRIGREVSQDASRCDFDSSVTFSRGLHNGSVNYGLYNGFGDTPVLTLINPRNVCAVPADNVLRSTAYLPVSIITEKTSEEVLKSGSTLDIADEYYADSVKQLKLLIKNNTPQELKKHDIMGDLSEDALKLIANSVENIEDTLNNRVIRA